MIPENIPFLELYGVKSPAEIIRNRTATRLTGLAGKILGAWKRSIDSHSREGAWTTRTLSRVRRAPGKSEILQSHTVFGMQLPSSMIWFLAFIDYKGGGMANLFRNFHICSEQLRTLTAESMRALASIKSSSRDVRMYLIGMQKQYICIFWEIQSWLGDEPMPHLFIISDEFARVKKEQPEFMAELVSTASRPKPSASHTWWRRNLRAPWRPDME